MADILIVDDSALFRRMLGLMLERAGHQVRFAPDGSGGVAAVEARRPDLVIVDLAMPVMDGVAFARRLKGDPVWSRVPVVMLTASAEAEDRGAAMAVGVDGFVTKPLRSTDVIQLVDGLLGRSDS
jgi:CheY-like chemotaxis protein